MGMSAYRLIGIVEAFGYNMQDWGENPERDDYRERARVNLNTARAAIREEWQKSDKAYNLYESYKDGQLTAEAAIEAIGRIYQ
jgi:hypothetical protein